MKPEPETTPSFPHQPAQIEVARARLSALADGDLRDASEVERACSGWREDAELRRTWHCYQLIGDVMRSEELARPAERDAAFLAGLRERLAAEPVILAPEPLPAAPARRRHVWMLPAAAVAGFVLVAGVLVVARVAQPGAEAGPGFAAAPGGAMPVLTGVGVGLGVGVDRVNARNGVNGANGTNGANRMVASPASEGDALLRDERLDEYLRVHQFARGGAALAAPSTAVRRIELTLPATPER